MAARTYTREKENVLAGTEYLSLIYQIKTSSSSAIYMMVKIE